MGLYIASSLLNINRVRKLRDHFAKVGIGLTYDWTEHGQVEDEKTLAMIAAKELVGVFKAKCLLLVFPAREGSHTEFGAALGLGIPIVILADDLTNYRQVSFHQLHQIAELPECCCHNIDVTFHTLETSAIATVFQRLNQIPIKEWS